MRRNSELDTLLTLLDDYIDARVAALHYTGDGISETVRRDLLRDQLRTALAAAMTHILSRQNATSYLDVDA